MEELKKLKLNNRSLEEFDKLMNYHLDKIEELEIEEININPKLYNLISLCTNLEQLVIKGDLRSDVNKIIFNVCKPENIKTLILESVKLPTNKAILKFTNLTTISLNNINFSNLSGFFDSLSHPEKVIALNLTDVDFGKKPISICEKFENLKYLNLDNLKNCIFDSFDFICDNKNISRFEFYNNEIDFSNINSLIKGAYNKRIEVDIKTNENSDILNSLEVNNKEISLTINSSDLENAIDNISLYKLTNLFIILEDEFELVKYIKKFKKVKEKVTIAIKDISYFNTDEARRVKEKLNVNFINILENPEPLKIGDDVQCYTVDEYIEIREEFEKIIENVIAVESFEEHSNQIERFNNLYNYFKNSIKYTKDKTDIKDVFVNKIASYNYFALAMNSCLRELGYESKVIKGNIGEEYCLWNQVKIDDEWYNFDLAYELKSKANKNKYNLFDDEQFYKVHTPSLESKPEVCMAILQEKIKEIKKEESEKKLNFFQKIYLKILSIFKFNKDKALPEPDEDKK